MKIMVLTGNIASGKSTVGKMFAQEGGCIIDADRIAREVVEPGQAAWKEIVCLFGSEILVPGSEKIDRTKLADVIFNDESLRWRLNKVVHPRVLLEMLGRLVDAFLNRERMVILDIPLFFELKLNLYYNQSILVYW